jgi:hypothetical protein
LKLRAKKLVKRRVNEKLTARNEKVVATTSKVEAALEGYSESQSVAWIEDNELVDPDDLGAVRTRDLNDAVAYVISEIEVVSRFRQHQRGRPSGPIGAWETVGYSPDWWDGELKRMFAGLRELQHEAIAMFPVPGDFLSPDDVPRVLEDAAATDLGPGDNITIEVPTGFDLYDIPLLLFDSMTFTGPATGFAAQATQTNRLRRLQELATQVEYLSGCQPGEAIAYLLCGQFPWVAPIEIRRDEPPGSIEIRVRHPEIPVEVVTAAYKDARREMGVRRGRSSGLRSGWPAAVYDFVTEWREANPGGLKWKKIQEAFLRRYPDAPYGANLSSLQETFYQERWRREHRAGS